MSDSIPVTIHVLRQDRFVNRFGDEIGRILNSEPTSARVHAYESRWGAINSDERRLQSSSRNGMVVSALGRLIERSGFRSLAFLGDLTHTHELVAQEDYGNEVFRFTVLNELNEVAASVRGFLAWMCAHPDEVSEEFWEFGCDREQNYYETVDEVLEKVPSSMDPNNEVTDGDFWDLALAVSLLKTLQEMVDYALETNQRVVCEQWGGFESASAGAGTSASLETAAPASTASELLTPSAQLAAIVGEQRLRRTEIVSRLWAYVKANDLQDSTTPRMINADARLLPIFGKAQVSMFELPVILGKHVL